MEGVCRNDNGCLGSSELRDANKQVAIAWDQVFLQQVLFGYADRCFCSMCFIFSVCFHFLASYCCLVVFSFFILVDFGLSVFFVSL